MGIAKLTTRILQPMKPQQCYYLTVNHCRLTAIIRQIETNGLNTRAKKELLCLLREIGDQEIKEEFFDKKTKQGR